MKGPAHGNCRKAYTISAIPQRADPLDAIVAANVAESEFGQQR